MHNVLAVNMAKKEITVLHAQDSPAEQEIVKIANIADTHFTHIVLPAGCKQTKHAPFAE